MRTRITPKTDTFHAVKLSLVEYSTGYIPDIPDIQDSPNDHICKLIKPKANLSNCILDIRKHSDHSKNQTLGSDHTSMFNVCPLIDPVNIRNKSCFST